jgi:hypothetical protein
LDPRIIALVVGAVSIIAAMTVAVSFLSVLKVWLTRKRREPIAVQGYDPEAIAQLQASVDAISIEIERISEGQRFTTKLLNERVPEADRIPAGPS